MGILSRLFGRAPQPPPDSAAPDHAVLVYLRLSDPEFGTEAERAAIHALADQLTSAITQAGAGEFDGDEFGAGTCTLYMYGSHADRLFAAVEPLLRRSPVVRGAHAIKRYGGPGSPSERVDFGEAG